MNPHTNHRAHLIQGIRARIEREHGGLRLLGLFSMLFDAEELPS